MSAPLQLVPSDELFATRLFGPIEIPADTMIRFADGLPGFPDAREFALLPAAVGALSWLQSLDDPDLVFLLVTWPAVAAVSPAACGEAYAIVTLDTGEAPATANLLAPVLIDRERRTGAQLIVSNPALSTAVPFDLPALLAGS